MIVHCHIGDDGFGFVTAEGGGRRFLVFGVWYLVSGVLADDSICHSGMGGIGDVAILSAAYHLELMPFAQIATRLGGAITITAAILLFGLLS